MLVIFGATGDLAQSKLYPALFDLFSKNVLPRKFSITAFARREYTDETYRQFVRAALVARKSSAPEKALDDFLGLIRYVKGDFDDDASYHALATYLSKVDADFNICSNKLFYLAVPPSLYENILNRLSSSGLTIPCGGDEGWTRVLIEKPFGNNIETARRLDQLLGKLFDESQIFRIDHYLAKETLQNILVFRFSNSLFEPIWNRTYIERIEIQMYEQASAAGRGAFYDPIGALRDVGQNHLLAMLSLITMEYPENFSATAIQKERARVLKALTPITGSLVRKVVRGQYEGYRQEKGVQESSTTETFFSLVAFVKNSRWKGVPIEISAGKALSQTKTEITIHFKDVSMSSQDVKTNPNRLTFRIQPNEGISILFWVKKPGFENVARPEELSFNYADNAETKLMPDAYERVLYDCVRGDQTLFASTTEMEAAWKFITPILSRWKNNPLRTYRKGEAVENIISPHPKK